MCGSIYIHLDTQHHFSWLQELLQMFQPWLFSMYSSASFWQFSYFLKQMDDHFCHYMFCYGSNCVWHIVLLRSCSSAFPCCSIELLYLFQELMIYGESWMELAAGNHWTYECEYGAHWWQKIKCVGGLEGMTRAPSFGLSSSYIEKL
jgi:hypothetical protein